jgi:OPA family glycerol-3-phosphate transporter-like MFS transporter
MTDATTAPELERASEDSGLRASQAVVVMLLFGGYAAYYFCRSDLSVAMPLLIDELHSHGMSADDALVRLGTISSFGVLAYAAGKLLLTGLGDVWGGKRSFTTGLGGAVAFTLLFASGGSLPLFTVAWIGNRLTQSIGWAGLIKVCSRWFGYTSYGSVAGILSVSYLIGDAAARSSMGALIARGHGWQGLFYFAAGVAACLLLANLLFLRESRVDAGYPEPPVNPLNLFAGSDAAAHGFRDLLRSLLLSRAFLLVCLLSLGSTIVRETFNTWTPVYLRNAFGYSVSDAASMSAIFPLVGAGSVIFNGWLSDRLGVTGRAAVMLVGLIATGAALVLLTLAPRGVAPGIPLVLIGAVAFCLLGPYSYLAGAFALDFGGREAGATSSGIIDGVGYFGGVVAGGAVAHVAVAFGWRGVFAALAAVSAVSAVAAGYLVFYQALTWTRRARPDRLRAA